MGFMRAACVLALFVLACGPSGKKGDDDGVDAMGECVNDEHKCQGSTYQTCVGGMWVNAVDCPTGCVGTIGCVDCVPDSLFCKDGDVHACDASGTPGGLVTACTGSNICVDGGCTDACADADTNKSYI